LLIADLIAPCPPEGRELFAATWDLLAEREFELIQLPSPYEAFRRERWNHYRYPDPVDQPSSVSEQLSWLRMAGFAGVGLFLAPSRPCDLWGVRRWWSGGSISYADALELRTLRLESERYTR
jgi:tRNA (cmo5U34)-methyltransferase